MVSQDLWIIIMAPYEYSALDEDASEIRLMTLLPGRFKDDISITLKTVTLTKEHTPQYEALSYVWGSPENPIDISVKAGAPEHPETFSLLDHSTERRLDTYIQGTISVTQNLATALPYLRKEDESRVFWIDAICVNQQDLAERGRQVKRMAAVYSMASQVIVWLGPESQNSTLALRAIDSLGSQLRVNWRNHEMTSVSTGKVIIQDNDPFNDHRIMESVGNLLRRSWFERLWIWQEVRLAREAYLFCGNEGVPWETLRRAVTYLRRVSWPNWTNHGITRCCKISDYRGTIADAFSHLDSVLDAARSASCSDPRDKIFAVLSLARESHTWGMDADYSKPAEAVFQDLVLHYTSNIQSLDILTHCELRDDTGGMELPTWVPNWTVPRLCEPITLAASCRKSKPQVRYQDRRVLAATGVHVAIIKCVENLPQSALPDQLPYRHEVEDAIRALVVPKIKSLSLSEREATLTSLCRTFGCNVFAERLSPPSPNLVSFEHSRKYMHRMIDATRDTALDDSQGGPSYLARVGAVIGGRSFFTTDDGYIGLAPTAIKPGDHVCVILGCQSPFVLRPCGDGSHKVVGECYIDGFMESAACLGPLPSNWQLVLRYFEEYSNYSYAFLNHHTGECQIEDPRLEPLPAGWYISDHEEEDAWNIYANDETVERTKSDPRMTPEALTARGVEMREFRLV